MVGLEQHNEQQEVSNLGGMILKHKSGGRKGAGESCAGFTLVELAILVALFGVVAAIAVPMLNESKEAAKLSQAIGDLRAIEAQIDIFEMANERLPVSLEEIGMDYKMDPWDRPYQYLNFDAHGKEKMRRDRNLKPINTSYDLYSNGKDGDTKPPLTAQVSWDDIVRANDGGFLGLGEDY